MGTRYSKLVHLYHFEGGSHALQLVACASSQGSGCFVCWLQEYATLEPAFWRAITDTPSVPHPLFAKVELRVQTDGSITPKEAVVTCCKKLVADLGQFSREFTKEFELRKMIAGANAPATSGAGQM